MKQIRQIAFFPVLVFLLLTAHVLRAQQPATAVRISGQVISGDSKRAIAGATVTLKKEDESVAASTVTSSDGSFSLSGNKGEQVEIIISYIGKRDYLSGPKLLSAEVEMGLIALEEEGRMLEGVTVIGRRRKSLVESKGDGLTYNASSDISNKSGTAADVLRKSPLLTVDTDGEVKMRGNSNIKVLLNGMPSGILAKNLKEALKMIPASSIESIEVITSPSAKYEAEGAAGVINIVTKKKLNGTSGTVDLSVGNLEQSGNFSLNRSVGKFNFAFMANASSQKMRRTSDSERNTFFNAQPLGTLWQQREATQRERGGYGSLNAEYRIDTLQKIELGVSYWRGEWPEKSSLYNRYLSASTVDEYRQSSNQKGKYDYYDATLNYQKKFGRKGQEFQFIAQGSTSDDKSAYVTDQFRPDGVHVFREESPNIGASRDYSFQSDYSHPLNGRGTSVLEVGVRYSGDNSKSDYSVISSLGNEPERAESMKYFQGIFSSYLSLNLNFKGDWRLRPGLRFETTSLDAEFKNNTSSFSSSFSNWVPSMLITKKISESHELKLNYTERIRRPWIWNLNPYVDARDPMNLSSGNPNLRPERIRMFELGHSYTAASGLTLISSIYYNFNSNAMESVTRVSESGVSHTRSENIGSAGRLGTNLNVSLKLSSNWTANAGTEVFFSRFSSDEPRQQRKGTFYTGSLNSSYKISSYSILVSGEYGNGQITLQGESGANYSYRMAIRKEILKNKASVTLSGNNLLINRFVQREWTSAPTFNGNSVTNSYNRSVSLAFSWQFGGLSIRKERESSFGEQNFDSGTRKR